MSGGEMLTAALQCVDRGWPVFPVNPTTNAPFKGSHGFKDATLDPDQVTAWWTHEPHAAIGVPTGVAFDVLDIDVVDDRPPREWADGHPGAAVLAPCEVHTVQARSGGGKWHLYFKPTGIGRRIRFAGSCDWLGTDGYVIVPPSGHKSGGGYSWIWSPDEIEIADAPSALVVQVMSARQQPERAPLAVAPSSSVRHGGWSAAGIIGRVAVAAAGERNTLTHWAAWRIGQDVRDHKAERSEGDAACQQLEVVAVNTGLTENEVRLTITSGYAAGLAGKRRAGAA